MKKDVEIVLSESEKEFDLIDTLMLNFLTTNDITSYTKYIRKTTNGFKNCDPEIVREFLRNYKELFDGLCDEVGIQRFVAVRIVAAPEALEVMGVSLAELS